MAIINDILDLSKIEAGKLEIAHHPFSLQALVVDIEKVIGFSATAKGLQFNVELPTKLKQMTFEGDAARIRQVLFNLVQNAVKFTASGSVDLVITHEGLNEARAADVRFEVRDTGIGIDAETSANIFEPFEQADNSTTRRFGGTGPRTIHLQETRFGHGRRYWVRKSAGHRLDVLVRHSAGD